MYLVMSVGVPYVAGNLKLAFYKSEDMNYLHPFLSALTNFNRLSKVTENNHTILDNSLNSGKWHQV